jgi:uncharacterized integral membrane protein (TIGR00697 family)
VESRRQRLFVVLCGIFLTALLIANVIAGKEFRLGGLQLSVGVLPFPITFLLTDIVNEYYGKEGARFLTLVGLGMMLFANAMLIVGGLLPTAATSWVTEQSYQNVFGLSWRLFLGSLVAYTLGQVSDIYSFQFMKRITGSKLLWLRATGSTFFSQIIDTVVVNVAIFAGMKSWGEVGALIFWSYVYKMVVAVGLTPLLYVAHGIIKRWLGIEPAKLTAGEAQ